MVELLNLPDEPEDFPEHSEVEPGTVRVGLYNHHPYFQCEHMGDLSVLPIGINGWRIVSEDPLTVVPSVMNVTCGCHGFITNGAWNAV